MKFLFRQNFGGGGHTSHYDRELVDTLGVQKNHISNGRRGGEGVPITIILKSGFPRHLYKGNIGKSPKITVFAYFVPFTLKMAILNLAYTTENFL